MRRRRRRKEEITRYECRVKHAEGTEEDKRVGKKRKRRSEVER